MGKQMMISISREFGSEGHLIGEKIAKDFGITLYDRRLLDAVAEEKGMDVELLKKHDEKPKNRILSRTVKGHSNSMEENIAHMQFEFLQKKAESGESFVVIGRCSETVLKDYEGLISIFVLGEKEHKIEHVMKEYHLSRKEAIQKIKRHNRKRKAYHDHYSKHKWRDSRTYDLCINSSKLGLEETAEILEMYIKARMQ